MRVIARAQPNIALIKYWGNRNNALRLPAADSVSMTLSNPVVTIEAEPSDMTIIQSFDRNGVAAKLNDAQRRRFIEQYEHAKDYVQTIGGENLLPPSVSLIVRSEIIPGIGLASSSAIFAATAVAYAELLKEKLLLTKEHISVIARLGSGSAARSIFGGFAALMSTGEAIGDAWAEQVADEHHWQLHDIIIAPETRHKKIGSTEGHVLASTSPHWPERLKAMPRRQKECIDAILRKDFEKLQRVSEEDCMDMHNVMMTSTPSLQYLNKETYRIVREIELLRTKEHLEVLYTMDAGPTVHLFCTEESFPAVREYAAAQNHCTVFQAKAGPGATVEQKA